MSSRDISEIRWQMVQSQAIRSCGTLTHLFIIWLLLFCTYFTYISWQFFGNVTSNLYGCRGSVFLSHLNPRVSCVWPQEVILTHSEMFDGELDSRITAVVTTIDVWRLHWATFIAQMCRFPKFRSATSHLCIQSSFYLARDNLRLSIKILYSLINVITNQRHVHLYKYMLSISS